MHKDIELITIKYRPTYLPREFSCCYITAVYIHPRSEYPSAIAILKNTITNYESKNPECLSLMAGHFHNAKIGSTFLNHHQIITVRTRGSKQLEKAFINIQGPFMQSKRLPWRIRSLNDLSYSQIQN